MYKFYLSFFLLWIALFVGTIVDTYSAEKKLAITIWPIEGKKKKQYFTLLGS